MAWLKQACWVSWFLCFSTNARKNFKSTWLIGKDSDAGRGWGQEEKGTPEDEMAGWHHWLNGREFEWTPGVGDGQGGLACCDSWGRKESDMTEQLNWTELNDLKDHITRQLVKWYSVFSWWNTSLGCFLMTHTHTIHTHTPRKAKINLSELNSIRAEFKTSTS